MKVTYEKKDAGYPSTNKCFNTECDKNGDTSKDNCDNGCRYTSNTGKCKNFKVENAKDHQIKYEIVNPFSIIDIYEKKPCHDQFLSLLKEPRRMGKKFGTFYDIKVCPTMMNNLSWLKEKGFVSKKKVEWVNVYIDDKNVARIGNFTYTSKEIAMADVKPDDSDGRYVGSILKV